MWITTALWIIESCLLSTGKFIDETSIIVGGYRAHAGRNSDQNFEHDVENTEHNLSHSSRAEATDLESSPIHITPRIQAASLSISNELEKTGDVGPRNASQSSTHPIHSSSISCIPSCEPETFEDVDHWEYLPDASTTLNNTPGSGQWDKPSQQEDAAEQALLSMRTCNHDPHPTKPQSANSSLSNELAPAVDRSGPLTTESSALTIRSSSAPLTLTEEAYLLRQFTAEVGTWMDLSDLTETFAKKSLSPCCARSIA